MKKNKIFLLLWGAICLSVLAHTQTTYPAVESDYIIHDFKFESGESLAQLTIHYAIIGNPVKDKNGNVINAVLIMHGTSGSGSSLLTAQFAGNLFKPGQTLDSTKFLIILPDAIGHGKSSKPSAGMRMRFPKYTYDDMVKANYQLITEHLGVKHLRLVMGTSMGGMQTWVWGYTYPDFMDALMPLASLPVEIAGRNRMTRKMAINMIKIDPEWKGGEYTSQPKLGLTGALASLLYTGSNPKQFYKNAPSRIMADSMLEAIVNRNLNFWEANDLIYQLDASRYYNPAPHLSKINVPLFAVNSADDEINPPELKLMEREIIKVKKGRYILLPLTDKTNGHQTCLMPEIWKDYLKELIDLTNKR